MPSSNPNTPRRSDDFNCPQQILVIRQGLSHPHEHNVVDLLAAESLNLQNLFNNFPRLQISRPSFKPARTELTSVGAANLSRNADGPPVGRRSVKRRASRDQNRFNEGIVLESKK